MVEDQDDVPDQSNKIHLFRPVSEAHPELVEEYNKRQVEKEQNIRMAQDGFFFLLDNGYRKDAQKLVVSLIDALSNTVREVKDNE